ncbi:hypothetical protein NL676_012420 [Syzygium grande]|nr:hypothetical protein NL676_012420 [Syzygium grande]
MECKESRGQIVLPVLYKVEPKDVKYLQGSVKTAFESRKRWSDEAIKQQGREALRKAAESRVFQSEKFADGREGELVNELVEIIMRKQQHDFQPHLPGKLVAIEDRMAEVMELVDFSCPDTQIIGIWGMGGIGKTTLAAIIYKKLFDKFECRSFIKDIRETINCEGIKWVQSLLISDITKSPTREVRDSDTGIEMIRLSCENKKVLILLDDVGHQDHLNNLIGGCNFKLGSRIIITCRDKTLLKPEYKMYKLKEMNNKESLLLFSRYAFEGEQPPTNLAALSSNIVATTGGLPLALMVIGSLLNGEKDPVVWAETLEKLRNAPDEIVQEKLRISYDTLKYKEQQMFLDIACFFIGNDKRIASYLWEDLKIFPITGLQVLINRSLIKIDDENRFIMHDQLRDLGRAIARPEDVEPWHWSRPWDVETMRILGRKEENEKIEALRLDERGSSKFMERESFKRMPNLKFLHLRAVGFAGDFEGSLFELRWLMWERCPDFFEATNVHLEKLVVLDLSSNNISEKWRGWSSMKMERLKVLNLSRCFNLRSTPNLSAFKNLEMLILERCAHLKEIDPSIGDVKRLISLNFYDWLSFCNGLKELDGLEALKSLRWLNLNLSPGSKWSHPMRYEDDKLHAIRGVEKLGSLEVLNIAGRKHIQVLDLSKSEHLKELNVSGCESLVEIHCPSKVLELFYRDGHSWFNTGDIGFIDEHGRVWLTGRESGRIKTGGENVYPEEVAAILLQHPGVAGIVVVGIPEAHLTEMVVGAPSALRKELDRV